MKTFNDEALINTFEAQVGKASEILANIKALRAKAQALEEEVRGNPLLAMGAAKSVLASAPAAKVSSEASNQKFRKRREQLVTKRIEAFLLDHPNKELTAQEVSAQTRAWLPTVRHVLSKMVGEKTLARTSRNRYFLDYNTAAKAKENASA